MVNDGPTRTDASGDVVVAESMRRAHAAYRDGQLTRAEEICRGVLSGLSDKRHAFDALHLLAVVQFGLKKYHDALDAYDRLLDATDNRAQAYASRGLVLDAMGRLEEALESYHNALVIRPYLAEALNNRARTLWRLRRFDEAIESSYRALAARPDDPDAHNSCGKMLYHLARFQQASDSYDVAVALRPAYLDAWFNLAITLERLNSFEKAAHAYNAVIALNPNFAGGYNNRAHALFRLQRFEEAIEGYEEALVIKPDYPDALSNRMRPLHDLHRFTEELTSGDRVFAMAPDHGEAHLNAATCRLLTGDFQRGFAEYEWRWRGRQLSPKQRGFPQPLWRGQYDIAGKTVLLHAEQGMGDTIQFCRYAPLVAEKGAHVILEVQASLKALLESNHAALTVLARGEQLPRFDFHCPLLSLPLAFGTGRSTVPGASPYLAASSALTGQWRRRFEKSDRVRVGIAWFGNRAHTDDRNRSIPLATLKPLFAQPVQFVSLQQALSPDDRATVEGLRILDFGSELTDFSQTAALISLMDIVISVDTAVAHLAAAIGRPTWILLPFTPDWRWMLDREDSPWYAAARLFRQKRRGDWAEVVTRVLFELSRVCQRVED